MRHSTRRKTALLYTGLAMIPNVILVLLLFVAMRTKLARCGSIR